MEPLHARALTKTEAALQASEERFSKFFHFAPMAIVITTLTDGIIRDVNEGFLQLTGCKRSDVIGLTPEAAGLIPASTDLEPLRARLREHGSFRNEEFQILTRRGELRDILCFAAVIELDGAPSTLTMFHDISQRKQLQREIAKVNTDEQLQIGYELHEDLAQQLASIALSAGLHYQKLEAEGSPHVEAMQGIVTRLADALAFARSLSRRLIPVDLHDDGLMYALHSLAENTEAEFGIVCDYASAEPVLIPDNDVALHLYRIAQEAITNAVNHAAPQHIELTLTAEDHVGLLAIQAERGETAPAEESMELHAMRHYAGLLGGVLTIRETDTETTVECRFPC